MKKIVNHPKGLRLDGVVESDGVGFLPIRDFGPMSMQTSGYFAYVGDSGMIGSRVLDVNVRDEDDGNHATARMDAKIKAQTKNVMVAAILCIIGCIVMMFASINWPHPAIWLNVFTTLTYLMLAALLLPKATAILVGRITRNQEMIEFSKFLGAKNAVENAYYDLGRVPSAEEVKDYSIHSSECEYTKNGYIACLTLVISCVRFLEGWWYWGAAILAIAILCALEWKNHLTFWQWLIVSKPDEVHYQVAIKAMEETNEIIDSIHVSYHQVDLTPDPENFEENKCEGCPAYDFCKEASKELKKENEKETNEAGDNNPAADNAAVDNDA